MAKTIDNLMKMFKSGSEADVRYIAFAQAADKEGYPGVAKIFRAVATAKRFHALSHFSATNMVDSTVENLKQAFEEESYDYKNAYPPMVQDAVTDDAINARHSLEYGMSIGPVIASLIGKASGDLENDEEGLYYVCPECGNIEFGSPPPKCRFCGVDAGDFVEVA
jgi:rubrerythrin